MYGFRTSMRVYRHFMRADTNRLPVNGLRATAPHGVRAFRDKRYGEGSSMAISIIDARDVLSHLGNERLLDVRRPDEFARGHIPGARNVTVTPYGDDPGHAAFIAGVEAAFPDTAEPLIVYCRSGVRSAAASKILSHAGYEDIRDYSGSWLDWTSDPSRPVER